MKFQGFSRHTKDFFSDLKRNNTRDWFKDHKKEYEDHVLTPAKDFVTDFGSRLKTLIPDIIAVPKINKSLFRINRDTRFSGDKSPYKTNMGLFFWEGTGPRMECSGVYVHFEPPKLFMVGVGLYMFPRPLLDRYRRAVVAPDTGGELTAIVGKFRKNIHISLGGRHYKRIPQGFPGDHPNAELLLHNGLYAGLEGEIPEEFYSAALIEFCFNTIKPLLPLHRWLVDLREGRMG
jgi:uncharacterized protein (TIGR02453 family)